MASVCTQGYSPDFPPSKLKTGCGEQCIWVLDRLADEALKAKNFAWKKSVPSIYLLFTQGYPISAQYGSSLGACISASLGSGGVFRGSKFYLNYITKLCTVNLHFFSV